MVWCFASLSSPSGAAASDPAEDVGYGGADVVFASVQGNLVAEVPGL